MKERKIIGVLIITLGFLILLNGFSNFTELDIVTELSGFIGIIMGIGIIIIGLFFIIYFGRSGVETSVEIISDNDIAKEIIAARENQEFISQSKSL